MKTLLAALAFVATLLALPCLDATAKERKRVPRFSDYPATEIHTGKSAEPILETDDQRDYGAYYRAVANEGANFAGHYAVVIMTCGSACVQAEFLDTKTGKISRGEFSNSGWRRHHDAFRQIEFRRGSRLIVFAGGLNEKPPVGWHFFRFDDGKLTRLRTIVTRGDFRTPLSRWMDGRRAKSPAQRSNAGSIGTR